MAEDFVFPEDEGTGAAGGDNADAANFATLAFDGDHRNHQIVPMGLTADFNADTLDVAEGLAVVSGDAADEAQSASTRDQGVRYAVILGGRTGLSIGSHRQEAVWLDIDLSTDDTINVVIQKEPDPSDPDSTNPDPPAKPRLKIGVVDNDENVTYEANTEEEHRHQGGPVRAYIRPGEEVTIPEDFHQMFIDSFQVDGKLTVDGKVKNV
jgi:hypothetical protein